MRFAFLTSTPLDFARGSGTFSGIATLARALEKLGHAIDYFTPTMRFPVYTVERLIFNEGLRRADFSDFDAVVGFDMDGYRIAGRGAAPHIASIKGVLADEMRFERGLTRLTMAVQAACERAHVRRADLAVTTSRYAAARIRDLYRLGDLPAVVPEAIDLALWRDLFARNPAGAGGSAFTILSVCRFYPRKRLHLLLRAAARLRREIAGLEVRIVGRGPEERRLHDLSRALQLGDAVRWLGDVSQGDLAREYNRADVFCLPSVQEGFGIVFLEAMAAGKPIVAANAAAVPEVAGHGLLAEPEDAEALAAALLMLYRDAGLRRALAEEGTRAVEQFDAPKVARLFLEAVSAAAK